MALHVLLYFFVCVGKDAGLIYALKSHTDEFATISIEEYLVMP